MATSVHRLLIATLVALASVQGLASSSMMEVKVYVAGGCTFVSGSDVVMNFGDLTHGDRTISATIPITCTNGTQFHISLDNGLNPNGTQRQMAQNSGSGRLPYSLSASPEMGQSTGSDINITLEAGVKQSDYQSRPVGTYSDTVIMTVDP
jgi:spore coat protein U-like protein